MATTDSNGSWVAMTPTQRDTAVDDNRTQHIRLSFAIHRLESCLGHAAPGRLQQWAANVSDGRLEVLLSAMFESRECVCLDDGLVEEIKITTPRLLNRIEACAPNLTGWCNKPRRSSVSCRIRRNQWIFTFRTSASG